MTAHCLHLHHNNCSTSTAYKQLIQPTQSTVIFLRPWPSRLQSHLLRYQAKKWHHQQKVDITLFSHQHQVTELSSPSSRLSTFKCLLRLNSSSCHLSSLPSLMKNRIQEPNSAVVQQGHTHAHPRTAFDVHKAHASTWNLCASVMTLLQGLWWWMGITCSWWCRWWPSFKDEHCG